MTRPVLNRSLTLETGVQTPDEAGGFVTSWTPLGILWCQLKPVANREAAGFEGPVSRVMYKITVRAAPVGSPRRPVAGQRMRIGTRRFLIEAVTEYDLEAQYLTCLAKEEVAS